MFNDNCWPWNSERDHYRGEEWNEKKKCWCWLIYSFGSFSLDESFIRWKMKINYITIFLFVSRSPFKSLSRKETKKKSCNKKWWYILSRRYVSLTISFFIPTEMDGKLHLKYFFSRFSGVNTIAKVLTKKHFSLENGKSFSFFSYWLRNKIMIHP